MKYRALRFAGRLFLSGRLCRGTAPRGNASLPTIEAGGNGRTWVVPGVGAQLCAPTLGGGRQLFSFWGFFINLGGYLEYTYSELILNLN